MSLFLSSDHHFGHDNILKWRDRYKDGTLEEMNEDLVTRWNETVSPGDTVYYLGDAVMGQRDVNLNWFSKLHGEIWLIPGNHDHVHHMHRRKRNQAWRDKWWDMYIGDRFVSILPSVTHFDWDGTRIKMCHFPYEGDHTEEERYEEWRPTPGTEEVLLHGHVHDLWKVRPYNHEGRVIRQINVGVDVHDFRPVSIEEVLQA